VKPEGQREHRFVSWITVRHSAFVLRGPAIQAADEGVVMDSPDTDFSRDLACIEAIKRVRLVLEDAGFKSGAVTGIGPVKLRSDSSWNCQIILQGGNISVDDAASDAEIVKKVRKTIQQQNEKAPIRPGLNKLPGKKVSMNPRPYRHGGPIMGGDPIWHNKAGHWGTVAFALGPKDKVKVAGNDCAGHLITAHHVVNLGTEHKAVSVTDYVNTMTVEWQEPPPKSGDRWMDLAAVKIDDKLLELNHVPVRGLEVRGLGRIQNVRQSRYGDRVYKYGATTGLTAGIDLGPALRDVDESDSNHAMYWVRVVSGHFADNGDSGAAVLDGERNLVGIVVSGKPGIEDETYYIQALDSSMIPALQDMSAFTVDGIHVS
jgi:hypothetical protein